MRASHLPVHWSHLSDAMRGILLLALLVTAAPNPVEAQSPRIKLENPALGHPPSRLGESVALGGDLLAAGAPLTAVHGEGSQGAVSLWRRNSEGDYSFEAELYRDSYSSEQRLGDSVAVSGDTVVAGTYLVYANSPTGGYWTYSAGAVHVFVRTGGGWGLEQRIEASDREGGDGFGRAVAIEGDTLFVGAPGDDVVSSAAGSVYVFERAGGVWTEMQRIGAPTPYHAENFGTSISISGDVALIGAQGGAADAPSGAAYVFKRVGGVWSFSQRLTVASDTSSTLFGCQVSLSGSSAVIGARRDRVGGVSTGSAYVFVESAGVWTEQQRITAADSAAGDEFGAAVQVWGDSLVVGAPLHDDGTADSGGVYRFERSGGVWTLQEKLGPAAPVSSGVPHQFGWYLSLSEDKLAVGRPWSISGYQPLILHPAYGVVEVISRSDDAWAERQLLDGAPRPAAGGGFGASLAASGDSVVSGSPGQSNGDGTVGAVSVFTRAGSDWEVEEVLNSPSLSREFNFGRSVAMFGDTLAVGAPSTPSSITPGPDGQIFVYARVVDEWVLVEQLPDPDPDDDDFYAAALALSGNTLLVGATTKGAVHVFQRTEGVWALRQTLYSPDAPGSWENFGTALALSGDTAVVGADFREDGSTQTGAAYVFHRSGGVWTYQARLLPPDTPVGGARFGTSVAAYGDNILVGETRSPTTSRAHIFSRSGTSWSLAQTLPHPDPTTRTLFGHSVALSGATAVVGTGFFSGANNGAAYVYTASDGVWTLHEVLLDEDEQLYSDFGSKVALSGDTVVVGAPRRDSPEYDSGAAYVFALSRGGASEVIDNWMSYE